MNDGNPTVIYVEESGDLTTSPSASRCGVNNGYLSIRLDEKEVVHCEFVLALLKSRIPMNITFNSFHVYYIW
jgi:hypothetical protein